MSLSSLRRFEQTGKIALDSLIRIAIALDAIDAFESLFPESVESLDDLLDVHRRQRGRSS